MKSIFCSSLICFTALQTQVFSGYTAYLCGDNSSSCSTTTGCTLSSVSSVNLSDLLEVNACGVTTYGILSNFNDPATINVDASVSSSSGTYLLFMPISSNNNAYFSYDLSNNATGEVGSAISISPQTDSADLPLSFVFQGNGTINLTNTANNFGAGSTVKIESNCTLEADASCLDPVNLPVIYFDGGYLLGSGTLASGLSRESGNINVTASSSATASSPFTLTGQIQGLSGGVQGYTTGMYLNGNINIAPGSGITNSGTGVIIIQNSLTQISGQEALGSNSFGWGGTISSSTLQFPPNGGDITITSDLVFSVNSSCSGGCPNYSGTIDMNGSDVTWNGDFVAWASSVTTSGVPQLQILDSNETPGTFYVVPNTITQTGNLSYGLPNTIEFIVSSGTLITNFATASPNNFPNPIVLQGGTLQAENVSYTAGVSIISGTTSTMNFPSVIDPIISAGMNGSGTLNVTGAGGSLTIENSSNFSGTLNLEPSSPLTVYADPNSYGTAITNINQAVTLIFENIQTPPVNTVSLNSTIVPQGGGIVTFTTSNTVDLQGSIGIGGSGFFFIEFQNTGLIDTKGNAVEGIITLEGQINLSSSSAVLTFLENNGSSQFSTVTGSLLPSGTDVITGSGSVVIAGSTIFANGSNPISNSFAGGLTLTSGTLKIYSSASLGSGTITGNGGTLEGEEAISISNNFSFNGGMATYFTNTSGFTLTGGIQISGTGIAEIFLSSGVLSLQPSSLTINQGTSFQTNGNSITTPDIAGQGSLILGYKNGINVITDTLTLLGTDSISYAGAISDNPTGGLGSVVIKAPVNFSGSNTFSGGLTLSSNGPTNTSILTINSADNVGLGTIYANGGGLANSTTAITSIDLFNPIVFTTTTSENPVETTFNVQASTSIALGGNLSATTPNSTVVIYKIGNGSLYIGPDVVIQGDGVTYDVTIKNGDITVDSQTPSTLSSAFIQDGVLRGREDKFFALADAFSGNWEITQTSPTFTQLNITVQATRKGDLPFLRGNGAVSNVVIDAGGGVAPGVGFAIGALTVTESVQFNPGSYLAIAINQDSGSILDVLGPVTIDSDVSVIIAPEAGPYLHTNHVILSSEALSGRFAGFAIPNSFFLDGFLDYSVPNEVILSIEPRKVSGLATGANAIAVADALDKVIIWNRDHVNYQFDSAGGGSTLHPFIVSDISPLLENVLASLVPFTTQEEMTDALNQLQPAMLKGFTIVQEDNIVKMRDALSNRMDYILDTKGCFTFVEDKACCEKDDKSLRGWISGMGDVLAQDSNTYADSPQVGYQSKMGGFAAGVDGNFAKVLYLGGIGGYTTSYVNWKEHQGTGNINTGYAGVYLSAISDKFYGNLSVIGGFSDFSSKRNIKYTGVDLTASGKHSGKQLLSHADTGFNFTIGGFTIRPFDSFDYVTQTETAYTEKGAGEWDLFVDKVNAIFLRNELGLTLSTCLCFSNMKWVIAPKASWVREVRVKGDTFTVFFAEAGPADAPFTVTGYFPDRSLFSPGVSLTGAMCQDRLTVQLNYNGAFMQGYSDHSYGGEIRYAF